MVNVKLNLPFNSAKGELDGQKVIIEHLNLTLNITMAEAKQLIKDIQQEIDKAEIRKDSTLTHTSLA